MQQQRAPELEIKIECCWRVIRLILLIESKEGYATVQKKEDRFDWENGLACGIQ
jgi:hypothetical protein